MQDRISQRQVSRLVIQTGQLLMQHGAESALIETLTRRIGLALGMDAVEVSLANDALIVTTLQQGHCLTTTRRCPDKGINMQMVSEVQRICILTEKQLLDCRTATHRLGRLKPLRYPRPLVILMVGLSCASFARLAGADWPVFALTLAASSCGIWVRQELALRHFNPLLNFAGTAFVTTLISSQGLLHQWGAQPFLAVPSSVLMLVPGFPLINAAADMVKGYINTGLARWTMATLLTMATSIGIVSAMNLLGVRGW
ncbi:threonine/serine exporter ThrE family protein [Zobellella sp. DQSA1]|uniref:threonine/serine ThrE exporter family protein n=1 Tax=Zobellella sp. DQSA1 TaxID=3342386 RepID=UPI0035C13F6D